MGNFMYYPLEAEASSYHRREDYNALGVRKATVVKEENEIDRLHRSYCSKIFSERKTVQHKRNLLDVSNFEYSNRYDEWSPDDISNFKAIFQYFDLNCDGLIDAQEMNIVLNRYGNTSRENDRTEFFNDADEDHSRLIDFDEFLVFLDSNRQKQTEASDVGKSFDEIVTQGAQQIQKIRQTTVYRQIANGFF